MIKTTTTTVGQFKTDRGLRTRVIKQTTHELIGMLSSQTTTYDRFYVQVWSHLDNDWIEVRGDHDTRSQVDAEHLARTYG